MQGAEFFHSVAMSVTCLSTSEELVPAGENPVCFKHTHRLQCFCLTVHPELKPHPNQSDPLGFEAGLKSLDESGFPACPPSCPIPLMLHLFSHWQGYK